MGKKLRIHLLKKLRKAFEFKRNEDKHHEAFRWNKIKHVNAIARKINFQKKKLKQNTTNYLRFGVMPHSILEWTVPKWTIKMKKRRSISSI